MNKLLTISIVLSSFMSIAQKKYIVEYDRINDNTKYYEMFYNQGEYTEKMIEKKPVLSRGDVVKFRSLNTNPLVLSFSVEEPEKLKQKEGNSKAILSGFSSVLTEMDGAIGAVGSELSGLSWGGPENVNFGRGTEGMTQAKKESLEQLSTFREHLKWTYQRLAKYQKSMSDVYSLGKTKEQILLGLQTSLESFEMDEYMETLRQMENEYTSIKSNPLLEDVDFSDIENTYKLLDNELNNSLSAPQNAQDLLNMVSAVSFTEENTTVVSYESGWSGGDLEEIDESMGSLKYVFDYRSLEETEDGHDDDNLIQSKSIELSVKSKSHFSWSTGFFMVSPFDGFNNFRVQEVSYDSIRVVNDDIKESSRFTLGTSLVYNFASRFFIVPQLSFGTSIAFLGSGWIKPLNFHLGAGFTFRDFPYISVVGGMAFSQNQMLRSGINLNESFASDSYYPVIEDYVQRTFSPGYYFGININL